MNTIIEAVWNFLNSSVGFAFIWAAMVGLFVWLGSKFNPFRQKWHEYEGSIITGIKLAEKHISDDTPNSGLSKLDSALRFTLKAYAEANKGKQPSAKLIEQIRQGIQVKHAELDRFGDLRKAVSKLRVVPLLLAGAIALSLSGCGAPMGKDISSGSSGGNAIKLANSHNNVVIITDGQLEPAEIIDSAGKVSVPIAPIPNEHVGEAGSDQGHRDPPAQ